MKKITALLFLLLPIVTIGQINFQPGYYIENGVKKECLIKNLAWKNNPVSIEYKTNADDEAIVKSIKDISEFSVDNAYKYRRYTVNIDRSGTAIDKLSSKKDPEWKTETVFLKILVEGKIILYQYEDSNFIKYFYSTTDITKAEQLVHKEYMIEGRVGENNFFRQQLYNVMKDNTVKKGDFERLKYKKDDLVKLFITYNGSTEETTVNFSEKQNQGSVNFKITPGASFSKLSADYNNLYTITSFAFSRQPAVRIGAEVEYIMPFNNNKWSLFIDPNYQYYKTKASKEGKYSTEIDYSYFEIPIGFRHYMYLNSESAFFVDAAYVMAIALGDSFLQYNGARLDIQRNSNFALGGGYSYKKYSGEVRYSFNHGIVNEPVWGTSYNSISIILGYKLF